jgi:hypothetical protein
VDSPDPQDPEQRRERVNRELIELLNELRIALPGVQVLFAFMLVLPFSQEFAKLSTTEKTVFFASFVSTALGTALLIAPSSYHRLRFRHRDKEQMLFTSNKMAIAGIAFTAVSIVSVIWLITDYVMGAAVAALTLVGVAAWFGWFWYGLPLSRRLEEG